MNIPFSSQQFLDVFKNYNLYVWPVQIILYLLAVAAVYFVIKGKSNSGRIISIILSFYWIWMGIVYHIIFFTQINQAAYFFGIIFLIQGILFFHFGFVEDKLTFELHNNLYGITGGILVSFALIIYPVAGYFFGHVYPYSPTFGLPCPTTIFTFGFLLWTDRKFPFFLLIIPFLWSITGFSAAISLGIYEDTILLISGLTATAMILIKNKKIPG